MTESAGDRQFRMLQERLEEVTKSLAEANQERAALKGKLSLALSDKEEAVKELTQIIRNIKNGNREQARIRKDFKERADEAEDLIHEGLVFPWQHPVFEGWSIIGMNHYRDENNDRRMYIGLVHEETKQAFIADDMDAPGAWICLMHQVLERRKEQADD